MEGSCQRFEHEHVGRKARREQGAHHGEASEEVGGAAHEPGEFEGTIKVGGPAANLVAVAIAVVLPAPEAHANCLCEDGRELPDIAPSLQKAALARSRQGENPR